MGITERTWRSSGPAADWLGMVLSLQVCRSAPLLPIRRTAATTCRQVWNIVPARKRQWTLGQTAHSYGSEGRAAARRGCRPDPAAYGLSPPLFQPLTAYAARGRIFPAPARGNPAPHGCVPLASLTPVMSGLSRSLTETFQRRSRQYERRMVQIPKLTVRVRVAVDCVPLIGSSRRPGHEDPPRTSMRKPGLTYGAVCVPS
jgi:hypothetical protein